MNRLFLWNSILLYRLKSIAAQNNINAVTDRKQFTRLQENWSARVAESTIAKKDGDRVCMDMQYIQS